MAGRSLAQGLSFLRGAAGYLPEQADHHAYERMAYISRSPPYGDRSLCESACIAGLPRA